jgi:sulfur carrier protein
MTTIHDTTVLMNGEPRACEMGEPLLLFLERQGIHPKLIAIEYNGEILHRQFWELTHLQGGDRLEIVTIVGGG